MMSGCSIQAEGYTEPLEKAENIRDYIAFYSAVTGED